MIGRWAIRAIAVASLIAPVVVAVIDATLGWTSGGLYVLYGAIAMVFVAVGWLIAERRPGNLVGLFLLAFGVIFVWYLPADLALHLPEPPPGAAIAAVYISCLDAPIFVLLALTLIVFPDGRLPSARWWPVRPLALISVVLPVIGYGFLPGPLPLYPAYTSPFGILGFPGQAFVYAAYVGMLVLLVLAAVALVVRWRRGERVERAQIKWVAAAAIVLVIAEIANVATFRADQPNSIQNVLASLAIALVPISIGIAILRYRLYDIDRLISRTISYGLVTGMLAATFVAANLAIQTALASFTDETTIAVATSTLVVFALFQPVRRRVQVAVDRRFDRARYDADQTVGTFAARLRGDLELDTVREEILATTAAAVRPTNAGVWIRGGTP